MDKFADNKFFALAGKAADMVILSFLWLLLCIPVLTIIPASIALYYTAAKVLRRECGSLLPSFFQAFRENMRQGIVLNVLYLLIAAVLIGIRGFCEALGLGTGLGNSYYVFYLVCIVMLAAITFYLLPVLSRFRVSLMGGLRLSLYFAFRNLGTMIPMLITLAGACALIYVLPVSLLVIPGFYAYLMTASVEKALREYILTEMPDPEAHAHMWYMDGAFPQKEAEEELVSE